MNKYTEIITKYITGQLSVTEKADFEKQLASNPELKAEYELQLQTIKGIQRAGIKKDVQKGFKQGSIKSKLIKFGTIVLIGALATTVVLVAKNKFSNSEEEPIRYELNEENTKQWSDADKAIRPQIFEINTSSDTVIETREGIVFSIPANAFKNKSGDVNGTVELEVKEAMNPGDIMQAGLSTMSDGKLLETGGMFYLNARQDGENLSIKPDKGIYTSIPDKNPGKEMMLFEGKRTDNGQINWMNPKPFENNLIPVDILSLNFYPPHFLDTLRSMGYDITNKKLTDSIYYSLTCHHHGESEFASENWISKDSAGEPVIGSAILEAQAKRQADSIAEAIVKLIKSGKDFTYAEPDSAKSNDTLNDGGHYEHYSCEIDPSKIHTIWDQKFNNTILATKEFEERLQVIFTTCNPKLLDLYVEGLSRKMYQMDSMAVTMLSGRETDAIHKASHAFEKFYAQRKGGVPINSSHMQKLKQYFEEKQKLYKDATLATLKKLYADENKKKRLGAIAKTEHANSESLRHDKAYQEEFSINLKEAYRQLGKEVSLNPPGRNFLSTTITTPGWKNVDAYVMESTINRTTLDYTDRETGKKAVIKYEPFILKVTDQKKYDKVFAYLLPDKLSSFQRMPLAGDVFKENLNELFKYSSVVIAFKGEDIFMGQISEVKPGAGSVSLSKITKAELDQFRFQNAAAPIDMVSELNYQLFEQKENIRTKAIAQREAIRERLMQVVFPCYTPQQQPQDAMVLAK